MSYIIYMRFNWSDEKNRWLAETRAVSFEEMVCLIEQGFLRAVLMHPRKENQKIFVVERQGYAFNVPFVEQEDGTCFLKTVYPSRTSTMRYCGGEYETHTN